MKSRNKYSANFQMIGVFAFCLVLTLLASCSVLEGINLPSDETATPEVVEETSTPTITEEPTEELPTATPTPTEIFGIPARIIGYSLWVRSGPDTRYTMINGVLYGDEVTLLGRNADNTWYLCHLGWVFAEYVETDEDVNQLPILYDPDSGEPKPTPLTPTPKPEVDG
jgi:hypothetical protein